MPNLKEGTKDFEYVVAHSFEVNSSSHATTPKILQYLKGGLVMSRLQFQWFGWIGSPRMDVNTRSEQGPTIQLRQDR